MFHYAGHQSGDEDIYFYHGDHLGSASWITEKAGFPIQYIHYLPYGEILANQMISPYDERFKFTTKELDTESGYYYFGARYLMSELGYFLSTDPLTDKNPEMSSYMYCNGNPIKYIDPDGRWFETAWDLFNLSLDIHSLHTNIQNGNVGDAIVDAAGLVLDAGSVLLPVVPGGAGTAIKAYRAADKVNDMNNLSSTTKIVENAKKRRDFEKKVGERIGKNKASQVTIEVKDGTKTRMDFISVENGELKLIEAKSSIDAPLTPNQRTAHPQIELEGGVIKGNKGNEIGLPHGTNLPPTKVDIIRPNSIDN